MFKPHYAICKCHGQQRLIVVSSGLCKQGNDERKGKSGTGKMQKRSGLLRKKILPRKTPQLGYNRKRNGVDIQKQITFVDPHSKKQAPIKKRSPIKYMRRVTGEGTLFQEIFESALQASWPEAPKCSCCQSILGFTPRSWFFSHVLAKQTYGVFRLWRLNIWLCCLDCHKSWDQGARNVSRFKSKNATAILLKRFYYYTIKTPGYDYSRLPESLSEIERILANS